MKKENLQSLERTEQMMVRWMCEVSLKDRKRRVDLYSFLGVQSVADVVRQIIIIIIIMVIIALDNTSYKMLHKLKSACSTRKNQL